MGKKANTLGGAVKSLIFFFYFGLYDHKFCKGSLCVGIVSVCSLTLRLSLLSLIAKKNNHASNCEGCTKYADAVKKVGNKA